MISPTHCVDSGPPAIWAGPGASRSNSPTKSRPRRRAAFSSPPLVTATPNRPISGGSRTFWSGPNPRIRHFATAFNLRSHWRDATPIAAPSHSLKKFPSRNSRPTRRSSRARGCCAFASRSFRRSVPTKSFCPSSSPSCGPKRSCSASPFCVSFTPTWRSPRRREAKPSRKASAVFSRSRTTSRPKSVAG